MKNDFYELTNSQKNIYLREQAYSQTSINTVSFSYYIQKPVNLEICKKAINEIIKRNDAFRLQIVKNEDGLFQKVTPYEEEDIPIVDCSHKNLVQIKSDITLDTDIPFESFENSKLYKILIYKLSDDSVVIYFKLHHIISDGWTSKVIFKQFNIFYHHILNQIDITDSIPSYIDYINTEKQYVDSFAFQKDKAYWENYLKNPPEMLSFKENILKKGSKIVRHTEPLSEQMTEEINNFCKEHNITPYVFFIGVYGVYIYKTAGKTDFIIGTPLLNRKNRAEKDTVGMYVATVPIRIKLDKDTNLLNLLKSIHHDTFEALRHQRYPYSEMLNYAKSMEHIETNLFDTILSFQNVCADYDYVDYDVNNFWNFPSHQQSSFELHIFDHNNSGQYYLGMDFAEGVVKPEETKFIYNRFVKIIKYILEHSDSNVDDVQYIPDEEMNILLNVFNSNKTYTPTKTLIELFNEQVEKHPDSIALKFHDKELTYSEFNQKVENFANILYEHGVRKNMGVTLLIHRSLEMLIAMFAVLKCGAYYLPVDPYWPADRVKFILHDSGSTYLVTHRNMIDTFSDNAHCIEIDNIFDLPDIKPKFLDEIKYSLSSLAYIIYTSGTTGKPKGILTTNYNIVYLLNSTRDKLKQNENDVWTLFHTYTFDFSTWEIYASLLYGGKLIIVPKETTLNPKEFLNLLVKEKVTILNQTPAYFYKVIDEEKNINLKPSDIHIHSILVGGEAVYAKPFDYWKKKFPQTTLYEVYGPTESTIFATMCELTDSDIKNNETFIGYPLQYYNVYIMDPNGNILPIGCDGEICISGGGLCNGYLNNTELTLQKFTHNKFLNKKIYKSGDLGFFDIDGRLGYIGRNDNQVKIRGFRVEIGEIEKEILACGNISKVLVLPVNNKNMTKSLVGFIETSIPDYTDTVISKLKEKLTQYMIPKLYQFENFPLNDNGKIDRRALLTNISNKQNNKVLISPRDDIEKEIYDILCKLLARSDISMDDDFFDDLGLDSLNIMELSIKLSKYNLDIQDINDYSNIEILAKHINSVESSQAPKKVFEDVEIINHHVDFDLSNVLLTGTTGFLGIHLLRELIENPGTQTVYCLIRQKNNKNANERISSTLKYYFADSLPKEYTDKIVVVQGNFELERLGLDKYYDTLLKKVTTVIHCGANVKHYGKYESFYRANVTSTINLIKFCEHANAKLAHISTISVGGYSKADSPTIMDENHINVGQEFKKHVYMITKYKAECAVLKAIAEKKIEAKVFRLGNIMPRLSDGKFQTNASENAFISRLKTFLNYNMITDDYNKILIDVSPVDLCAKSILQILLDNNNQTVYHIYNNNIVSIKQLLTILKKDLKIVSNEELINHLNNSDNPFDAHLLNDLIDAKYIETPVSNTSTIQWLNSIGFKWNKLDYNYLQSILK